SQITGRAGAEILPADPRLSGPLLAGLADPQAKRDQAGAGRTSTGGPGLGLECPPGGPPTALAASMAQHPTVDTEEELDRATAENDAEGNPVSCPAGVRGGCLAGLARLGWL